MTNIHIPPEAVEAARKAFANAGTADDDLDPIEATIRAALAAWPGVEHQTPDDWSNKSHIILPLNTENPDAEA